MRLFGLGTAVLILTVCLDRGAFAIDFDFETTAVNNYQGGLSVISGGLTLAITPEGNPNGYIEVSGSAGLPTGVGSRAIIGSDVFPLQVGGFAPIRFTFSQLVKDITFVFGDGGGDEDSPVTVDAYNSASILLGSLNSNFAAGQDAAGSVGGTFPGAKYFIASSGSVIGNEHSLYWEVRGVTTVPEPTTPALLAIGMLASLGRMRRTRSQSSAKTNSAP